MRTPGSSRTRYQSAAAFGIDAGGIEFAGGSHAARHRIGRQIRQDHAALGEDDGVVGQADRLEQQIDVQVVRRGEHVARLNARGQPSGQRHAAARDVVHRHVRMLRRERLFHVGERRLQAAGVTHGQLAGRLGCGLRPDRHLACCQNQRRATTTRSCRAPVVSRVDPARVKMRPPSRRRPCAANPGARCSCRRWCR